MTRSLGSTVDDPSMQAQAAATRNLLDPEFFYLQLYSSQHQAPVGAVFGKGKKAKIMEGGDVVDKGYQPKFGLIYSHILLFSLARRGALLKKNERTRQPAASLCRAGCMLIQFQALDHCSYFGSLGSYFLYY
jgi:hypothetical protein